MRFHRLLTAAPVAIGLGISAGQSNRLDHLPELAPTPKIPQAMEVTFSRDNGLDSLISDPTGARLDLLGSIAENGRTEFFSQWKRSGHRPNHHLSAEESDKLTKQLLERLCITDGGKWTNSGTLLADCANWALHEAVADLRRSGTPRSLTNLSSTALSIPDYILTTVGTQHGNLPGDALMDDRDAQAIEVAIATRNMHLHFSRSAAYFQNWRENHTRYQPLPKEFNHLGYLLLADNALEDRTKGRILFAIYLNERPLRSRGQDKN